MDPLAGGGTVRIEISSGDEEFNLADFAELEISTTSGAVVGSLRECTEGYAFDVSSASGEIRLPERDPAGAAARPVSVTSGSGDIEIRIGSALGG